MEYVLTFVEGVASFISPCLLPMLPIYLSYFAGKEEKSVKKTLINSIGFVLGFSLVFLILSLFASTIGSSISTYMKHVQIVFGVIIIILGLNYMEVINLKFLSKIKSSTYKVKELNFISALVFGIVFSISWTPCIGTFLASALMLISKRQDLIKGMLLMIVYSLGLGIPFIISAFLIEKIKNAFNVIKKNYRIVKIISGIILIIMGVYVLWF